MTAAIDIKNLSKKYSIGISSKKKDESFREIITHGAKNLFSKNSNKPAIAQDNEFWALQDINLTINQGERVGIIGHNGAGKSTLLKIISRITHPTAGEIAVSGRISSLLEVGTGFHPDLTGRENVFLNGAILGMTRNEMRSKFDEIVDFSGVEQFIDTPVKRYSSGMYTRLAFAVAAHLESEILIVDEVLAVGDAEFQKKCMGKMDDMGKKEGRTVILVSHNINAIQDLCSKVAWLEKGHIKEVGTDIRKITSSYLNGENLTETMWVNHDIDGYFHHENFTPLRLFMGDEDGQNITTSIEAGEKAYIYMEANIEKLDPALTMGYALFNEDDVLLYWSYFTDMEETAWPLIKQGKNMFRSALPPHLLNEGTYTLQLIGGLHFREWIFEPRKSPIKLNFTIQGGLSNSPMWSVRRDGILAPVLKWENV